jgi:hypothetical protein
MSYLPINAVCSTRREWHFGQPDAWLDPASDTEEVVGPTVLPFQ